jgi:hypothetical protein
MPDLCGRDLQADAAFWRASRYRFIIFAGVTGLNSRQSHSGIAAGGSESHGGNQTHPAPVTPRAVTRGFCRPLAYRHGLQAGGLSAYAVGFCNGIPQ